MLCFTCKKQPRVYGSYCRDCNKVRSKANYEKNKVERKKNSRTYYAANREHYNAYDRERYHRTRKFQERNKEQVRIATRAYMIRLRNTVIDGYGGSCSCCKEDTPEFLAVDHVNNNGAEERKSTPHSTMLRKIIKDNFPSTYQLLCHNCNSAKGFYGACPHQRA